MSADILKELSFLFSSMLTGILITFVYDILRIFRRVVKHNGFFVSFEDFWFWAGSFVCIFYLLYRENNGTLRWFVVLGAAAGMFLYKLTAGRFFVRGVSFVLCKVLGALGKVWKIASRPFRMLGRVLKKKLTYFKKVFKMILYRH